MHGCKRLGASDATFHIMWIILFNALDDFGMREVNDLVRTGSPGTALPNHTQIEGLKQKFGEMALHGALRIAGLVSAVFLDSFPIYVAPTGACLPILW